MIYGFFHPGSGLGNMLHRYVATRVCAKRLGVPFSMIGREFFKGSSFMKLDMGEPNDIPFTVEKNSGKILVGRPVWEEKTKYYNPEFNFIEDETIIDGEFQDERYFEWELDINEWISFPRKEMAHDVCVIGFRGGEFTVFPELFLPKSYWDKAIAMMKEKNPNMKFEVHTDDPVTAKKFFPDYECVHDIERNWLSVRYAKNAIIANSSFYIFPRFFAHWYTWETDAETIAPRYWARHNIREWSMPQNYYKDFTYI